MFDNIGGKIKTLAIVVCWIGIIACIVIGVFLVATDENLIFAGVLTAVGGSLLSWVSAFVLYGFGQLVENSDILVRQNSKLHNLNANNRLQDNGTHTSKSTLDLEANVPMKPKGYKCPMCGKKVLYGSIRCDNCGQILLWEE